MGLDSTRAVMDLRYSCQTGFTSIKRLKEVLLPRPERGKGVPGRGLLGADPGAVHIFLLGFGVFRLHTNRLLPGSLTMTAQRAISVRSCLQVCRKETALMALQRSDLFLDKYVSRNLTAVSMCKGSNYSEYRNGNCRFVLSMLSTCM